MTEYLTTKEASAYLRIARRTLQEYLHDPEKMRILNPSRITPRKTVYTRANLDQLVAHFQQFADPLPQTPILPIEAVTAPAKMETWAKRKGKVYGKLGIAEGERPGPSPRPIRMAAAHGRPAHPRD